MQRRTVFDDAEMVLVRLVDQVDAEEAAQCVGAAFVRRVKADKRQRDGDYQRGFRRVAHEQNRDAGEREHHGVEPVEVCISDLEAEERR